MKILINKSSRELASLVSFGEENNTVLDKFCAFLIALTPLIQHYRGIYENAGFTVYLLVIPYLTLKTIKKRKINKNCFFAIIPLLMYEAYSAFIHSASIQRYLYSGFMIWLFICLASGSINTKLVMRYAIIIVNMAAVCLVVQYISYYIFHNKLELRAFDFLADQDAIWIRHAKEPPKAGKLYRPAAFFMEPSHFFLYTFPLVAILLLSPGMTRWRMKQAIITTIAALMTTSGFSVFVFLGFWALYFMFYSGKAEKRNTISNLFSSRTWLLAFAMLFIAAMAYFLVPTIQTSVNRVFMRVNGSSTAISGRITSALNYVKTISGIAVIIGEPGVVGTLTFNVSGFFATYIKLGIIGLLLIYWFYGQGMLLLKKAYLWMSFVIIIVSFFSAHTHGTFYMTYYIIFLLNGYSERKPASYRQRQCTLTAV